MIKPGDHLIIIGRTGSGKTIAGVNAVIEFRKANPSVGITVINHKNSKDWNKLIPPLKKGKVPLYKPERIVNWVVRRGQDYDLEEYLDAVYDKGKPHLIVYDEGTEIPRHWESAKSLWTQGREMKISVFTFTQRPVDVSKYSITQAAYIRVFNVIGRDDLKALDDYMAVPLQAHISPSLYKQGIVIKGKQLEDYHSVLYDVKAGTIEELPPEENLKPQPITQPKPKVPYKKVAFGFLSLAILGRMLT